MTGLDNGLTRVMREAEVRHLLKNASTHNCYISYVAVLYGRRLRFRLR